jgi:uncharacterized membrane protein YhaH (DUF805 family)
MELFLSMDGRIGRGKFWLGVLGIIVAYLVLSSILFISGLMSVDPETGMPRGAGYWIASFIVAAATIWPSLCIYGKRFHDRDKSAWWILIGFVPIIGPIWLLIECGLLQGTDGPNRFGPDPLAEG